MKVGVLACIVFVGVSAVLPAHAQSPYSRLKYKSPEGWDWDWRTGVWRNPKPVYDKDRKEWINEFTLPSAIGCCDKTGLSFPTPSANYDELNADDPRDRPKQEARRPPPDGGPSGQKPGESLDDQIKRIQQMDLDPEVKRQAIENLRSSGGRAPTRKSPPQGSAGEDEGSTGRGHSIYGSMMGQSPSQLNAEANGRRRDPSRDPNLGDIIGGGLAAGAVAAGAIAGAAGAAPSRGTNMGSARPVHTPKTYGQGSPGDWKRGYNRSDITR